MERANVVRHKEDQNEGDTQHCYSEIHKSVDRNVLYASDPKAQTMVKGRKPAKTLVLQLIQSETCENWFQELFFRRSRGLQLQIPKQLVSLEEEYMMKSLELMHINALKGAPCALSVNLGPLDFGFVSDYAAVGRSRSSDMATCAIDYPMTVGSRDLVFSSRDEDIVGSIMGSNSMMRIMRNPLFQRLGILDRNEKLGGTKSFDDNKCIPSYYQGSPGRLTPGISHKHGEESLALRNQQYRSDFVQTGSKSMSSGISVLSDQACISSLSPKGSQGMLHFTWDNGIPNFTFTLDDQKELYVANAWKAELPNDKALDFVYSFHLKAYGPKLFDSSDHEVDLIGKMKVSTSFSLCSSNSRIMETEFVLVGTNENHSRETHTLSRNGRRSRKLSKVMDVFKAGHSFKQRTPSLFGGSNSIPEDFSPEKGLDAFCSPCNVCKPDLLEDDFLPNLEMAAIVVKNHVHDEERQKEVGGWGLKFLKKAETNQTVTSESSTSSECCLRNVGDCSTSLDIIVPAGPHGGPKTKKGGPSGLVERWRSGGNCDCGGWDTGCPLKTFKATSRREEGWSPSETQGDCKSFDIFLEGSAQETPALKMVNIRDGLYFISFQPSFLSALQCFSIAVAIIHSQSPSLHPKHVQH
ncbi:uncharacterized protein LOC130821185 [Amaranthus tricolor]|uniref:uncharacterized protein LOC130821185 n=1 Tax=Amaranthus tricolor TaxID=29722 RepID=UPI0025881166|nr:uncharacterized protein LOC130821185 [Amaranthus tricolor]